MKQIVRHLRALRHLPRNLLGPIMPKHRVKYLLRADVGGQAGWTPIGYISTRNKAVIYGKDGNYSSLYFWGMIPD